MPSITKTHDKGVIKQIESVATHVTQCSCDDASSALRVTRAKCVELHVLVETKDDKIRALEAALAKA